ncbi:sensitivity to high expression protein she9 [Tilletia horrida]|uniref:Sensitive to high expression protein 9, mitochondrial n=1 Tax=Tilletia horrida TaxID=155126 RepID=A0AAN6JRT6_9BASI|nr:sensitivity to high expression protein she9 [Tilletia horrida]
MSASFAQQSPDSRQSAASLSWVRNGAASRDTTQYKNSKTLFFSSVSSLSRANLDDSKRAYVEAVNLRSNSQKLINDLLSRKSSWSEDDLSSYTALLRSEHSQTRAETDSQSRYEQAERELQSAFDDLVRAVMRRYHEEQIWSDKVRNASSYASLVVAALNILIFTAAIIFVEPYKRRKLAETFEKRLLEGEAQGRALIQATIADFEARTAQAQEALTNEVRDGYGRILSTLGASPPPPTSDTVSSGLQRPTLPLAARLRVGLADEEKRNEWAVTSGLGALAGVAITLAFAFLAGGSAGGLPPGPGQ